MSGQSTQYNKIPQPYAEICKHTAAIMTRVNVREIVLPFIQGATVLDLACGNGFHTTAFLEMGAKRVVGVDISSAMLEAARGAYGDDGDRITFIEADGTKPVVYPGGPFDVVFGGWFLNYAPDKATMVKMYSNIFLNLKPGGHFVGITPVPTNDPESFYKKERALRPLPKAGGALHTTVVGQVEDGLYIRRHRPTTVGDVDFNAYHLHKDVWEAAAKEAGFKSEPKWALSHVPSDFLSDPGKYGEVEAGENDGVAELDSYNEVPGWSVLQLRK